MNMISCKNVSFAYDNVVTVKDLNFSIVDGDYFCIVGKNGSGKSRFRNMTCAFLWKPTGISPCGIPIF